MKWFRKKEKVEETPSTPPPKKPKYYSVTKKEIEWIDNDLGSPLGWWIVQAEIVDRDTSKVVDSVKVFFDSLDDADKVLKKLQDDIHDKIITLYKKEALLKKLQEIDVTNNGLEIFIS